MRKAGGQAKTVCGRLKLCAGIESNIEGATHSVAQQRQERYVMETERGADEALEGAEDEITMASGGTESAG